VVLLLIVGGGDGISVNWWW